MNSGKLKGVLIPRSRAYVFVILMLLVVITILDWTVAVPGYVIFLILLLYNFRVNYKRQNEIAKYIEDLTFNVDSASRETLLNFPMPLVVMELDGSVIWYNQKYRKLFTGNDALDKTASDFLKELDFKDITSESNNVFKETDIGDKRFRILGNLVKSQSKKDSSEYILLLYFLEITELHQLKIRYKEENPACGIIMIDNYDDLMQGMDNSMQSKILAEVEKRLVDSFSSSGCILKKYERDKYLLIIEYRYLEELENKKFEILDIIKEIEAGNKIPVTLSIGIGASGESFYKKIHSAEASVDLALGRGGDQVVIKENENFRFFGGRSRELEKRTKVRARVIAYALRELIDASGRVLIMGHKNPDVDAMGAALGIYRIAKSRNKEAYIVLEDSNPNIDSLMDRIKNSGMYTQAFIGGKDAEDKMRGNSLLVIVDTYRGIYTEHPELLDYAEKIVVIDHHRRGADFISNATLTYQEIYASSTSEMITEIVQYVDSNLKLNVQEAEALYAGIVMDTKGFTFKTGVRTFEAASYLRKQGADTLSVKQLFQNDLETFSNISAIVQSADIVSDGIALSTCDPNVKNSFLISAKAADEILNLSGINAAFVLCEANSVIAISGRSFGDINVQVILEKLGGGGHQTVAGAQLKNTNMKQAQDKLKYAIMEYVNENTRND